MKVFFWSNTKEILKVENKIAGIFFLAVFFILVITGNVVAGDMVETIRTASQRYQISEDLIFRVIMAESSFNAQAKSHSDARGLMQITRPTWDWICRDFLAQDWSFDACAFDVEKNIIVGTCFLRWINDYLDRHQEKLNDERIKLVLACYNAGPGAVRRYGYSVPPFPETRRYVEKILHAPAMLPAGYSFR